jgi:hypothetical protein
MAVENPPLNRIYVLGYSANDRDFPIVSLNADPRVAGYKVPEDLSTCPDKRYPNHVFTGSQPLSGDERVRHVWEILPSPTVPFTRYDDDLGPVQGRRRSVKNEGQVASLAADKRVTYEAREGSAIVYTELEESWSIKTDEDGNSLFPFKDRDFYDASRGPVQERRQLFTPTGEEEGSLENVNGVITQTSYEPYNEFLSVKVVQTYKVDGPQLIGRATDNDGQLITVTTQRKGADSYIPPNPTATRTVEVNREDAESLVERIVDTPEVFKANTFSVERPDPIPQKFRVAVPIQSSQEIVEGDADPNVSLDEGELSKSEEQRNKFIKRVSSTSRDQAVLPQTLTGKTTNNERQEVIVTETLQLGNTIETPTATKTVESEALGDGNYVITKTQVDEVFSAITLSKERPDPVPPKFRAAIPSLTRQENLEGEAQEPTLVTGEIVKSEQQVNQFVKRISTTSRDETNLPQSLTQKTTTNEGLLATVSETLQSGDTTVTPTATKSVQSEALGDGTYVVTVTDLPKVFAGDTFSVERPDPFPQKFRVAAITLTQQQIIEGTANPDLDLVSGQISKSEQQVTEFVKRTSVTSRDQTQLPVTLVQRATDNEKQLVTVTESLQSADSIESPSATVTIQSEALGDGNFLVTKSEVPEVFGAETFRKTKEDLTPQKFRAAQEDTTFEETIAGEVDPDFSLDDGEFSKSEQQVNKFVKRVATTSRSVESPPPLTEFVLTQQGQIGTRTLTLSSNSQTISPNATLVDGNVEALGDGRTVKTEVRVPNVFPNKTITKAKIDLTPEKFKAKQEDTTIEESIDGTVATNLNLAAGEFRKSEQQVTEFVKRISTTARNTTVSDNLEEFILTPQGQLATRTLRLSYDSQSIQPDALLVDGSIEALGDGRTIKTEVKVGEVFENGVFSIERPDPAPEKFRVELPTITEQKTIEGIAEIPELESNDLSKSEQQQTEFIKRTTVSKRDETTDGELIGKQTGQWGEETVTETYNEDGTIDVGHTILSNRKTPLGGGKFLGEKVQVESPVSLTETKKDAETGIIFTTTKTLVAAGTTLPDVGANSIAEITPIDAYNSVLIVTSVSSLPPAETFQTSIDVSYPDVLEVVGIDWESSTGGNSASAGISSIPAIIANDLAWQSSANATASARIVGSVFTRIRKGHRGTVRATVVRSYSFNPPTSIPTITKFNPVYGTVTIRGKAIKQTNKNSVGGFGATVTGSAGGGGFDIENFASSVQFGPFCHSGPSLQSPTPPSGSSATFSASGGSVPAGAYPATSAQATATASAQLQLSASEPSGASLVTGFQHVAAVRVEKWRFGIWIQEVYTATHP